MTTTKITPSPPSTKEEEEWNFQPDDDEECSSNAAAIASTTTLCSNNTTQQHTEQTKKSWVLTTPPRSIDLSHSKKKKHSNNKILLVPKQQSSMHSSRTPTTLASTPSQQQQQDLPETYVEMIQTAFGKNADLYQDVLGVEDRNASPRAIRIAYFQRGRQVLTFSNNNNKNMSGANTISGGQISEQARVRFQAVSMAFEIISNPTWLDAYERCRLVTSMDEEENMEDEDESDRNNTSLLSDPSMSSTKSLASTSALRTRRRRRSHSADGSGTRRKSGSVRWNEEVEELVFNQDPLELSKKKKRKKKKKKKRIAVDNGESLEQHLSQLDKEAEKTFVHDFLDDLEQSIDQLLSFGGNDDDSDDEDDYSDDELQEQQETNVSRKLFREREQLAPEEFKTPTKQSKTNRHAPNAPRKKKNLQNMSSLDIDDEEFQVYKKHRQRGKATTTNPFDDNDDDEDARQEVAAGAGSPIITPRQGSANDEHDDADSYVSFQDFNNQVSKDIQAKRVWRDNTTSTSIMSSPPRSAPSAQSDVAHFSPRTPPRGASAWQPSPHSPKHSPKRPTVVDGGKATSRVESSNQQEQAMDTAPKLESWVGATGKDGTPVAAFKQDELMFASPDGEQARIVDPTTPPRSPKSSPRRKHKHLSPRSKRRQERRAFLAPEDIEVSKINIDEMPSFDDTVSTLSASVVQRHINRDLTNSRYKGSVLDESHMERVQEEDGGTNNNTTTDAIVVPTSPGDGKSARQVESAAAPPLTPAAATTNTEFVQVSPKSPSEMDAAEFCMPWCGDSDLAETARAASVAEGDGDVSFSAFFMVYLNAMISDISRLGHSIQEGMPCFSFMEISENDLDGMLTILETEMEEVPDDIAKTLSQEFLPVTPKEDASALRSVRSI